MNLKDQQTLLAREIIYNIRIAVMSDELPGYRARLYHGSDNLRIYLSLGNLTTSMGHFEIIDNRVCGCYELAKEGKAQGVFNLLSKLGYKVQRGTKQTNKIYGRTVLS